MDPGTEPSKEGSSYENGKRSSEKDGAPSKLLTIDVNHMNPAPQKLQAQPTIANMLCRPRPTTPSQISARVDSSWMSNQQSARGIQMPLAGHSIFPPHLCYGYFPPCHGFLNNSFTEYLALDPTLFLRRQKPRTIFTADQLKILEATFKSNSYPSAATRKQVANKVGLPVDRVRVWFQNRRAKEKRLKEDRLALSLLSDSTAKSLASTSRLQSELLQQKLGELQSNNKRQTTATIEEDNPETEEALVRNLLKEARAREIARNNVASQSECSKCCTVTKPDTADSNRNVTESIGSQQPSCSFEEEIKRTELLANKMYAQHIRILNDYSKKSDDENEISSEHTQL